MYKSFFFFKQKTAYDMRISDWSSDVCSSDLVAQKLMGERVAIVGLGGTGAYVLDQVAKTAVARIDLFDDDYYLQHNAFRAPGAASLEDLRERPTKVHHFARVYSRLQRHIVPHAVWLGPDTLQLLGEATFVLRSDERRVGKGWIRTSRYRWLTTHKKN